MTILLFILSTIITIIATAKLTSLWIKMPQDKKNALIDDIQEIAAGIVYKIISGIIPAIATFGIAFALFYLIFLAP